MESLKKIISLILTIVFILTCRITPDQKDQIIQAPVTVSSDTREIYLLSDKISILGDGSDIATFTVTRKENGGPDEMIGADYFLCTDSSGVSIEINENFFSSYTTGTYSFVAVVGDKLSNPLSITVSEIPLENEQVQNIAVRHYAGQTFITWDEIYPVIDSDQISLGEFKTVMESFPKDIQYNVYSDPNPIINLSDLEPIATVLSSSVWNDKYYGLTNNAPDQPLERFIVEYGGEPLEPGTGLFVNNPESEGQAYYSVTAVIDGIEQVSLTTSNVSTGIMETTGQGKPVLQKIENPDLFQYISNSTLYYYVRWEAPPNCNIMGKPYNYIVAKPQNMTDPAPVGIHMHCWGGSMKGGYGWWYDAEEGSILLASNQYPYDWWTGYHENLFTENSPQTRTDWENGVVRPYSQNRMYSFLKWLDEDINWNIDLSRTFTAGSSMGGSGSLMFAIRNSDKVAWCHSWVGVHDPSNSPNFTSSYAQMYGPVEYDVRFEDGTDVWDYFNDIWYLENNRDKDIGFLTFCNGKNDSAIGWEQAVDFYNALQETRQPHLFVWGQAGHSQRAVMPYTGEQRNMTLDIRLDQTLPAFTNCSLDDNPGNGDPSDGDETGQINRYLYWETESIIDTALTWEMVVALTEEAPENTCTVNITPRRCQQFSPSSGTSVTWKAENLSSGIIQTGTAQVDTWGLITLDDVNVSKDKVKVTIF
ncbi:MAG: hypothetical protein JEY91_12400 [Spirochaetaceae bacterium]|nr:hypothetical protein [Spirochaetaceae bacterium]